MGKSSDMKANGDNDYRPVLALLWFTLAGLSIVGFHATGEHYGGYFISSFDNVVLPNDETGFYTWFFVYGITTCIFLMLGCRELPFLNRFSKGIPSIEVAPYRFIVPLCLLFVVLVVFIRFVFFLGEPVTDDELVYRFIAQTLLRGELISNVPPVDTEFLQNQFVIANEHAWYGKYPIGHPLFLAIGDLLHLRGIIVPLLGGMSIFLTFLIGRTLFTTKISLLGCLLLALSPQFLFMSATELSQPTDTFLIVLGAWCLLASQKEALWRWTFIGAIAFGLSVLVRPLPGVLCVAVGAAVLLDMTRNAENLKRRLRLKQLIVATLVIVAITACILITNSAQNGNALQSGYQVSHGAQFSGSYAASVLAPSLFGSILRQSFWLFGVPLSLLFVPFARPQNNRMLFWGLIAAVFAYRLVNPKTGPGTTGPVYLTEAIPFLCLATSSGLSSLSRILRKLEVRRPKEAIVALVFSTLIVSVLMFLPIQLTKVVGVSFARQEVMRHLAAKSDDSPTVVFTYTIVDLRNKMTWAFFAPSPHPNLKENLIFLRLPRDSEGLNRAINFWQKEMPERRAFVWRPREKEEIRLLELSGS